MPHFRVVLSINKRHILYNLLMASTLHLEDQKLSARSETKNLVRVTRLPLITYFGFSSSPASIRAPPSMSFCHFFGPSSSSFNSPVARHILSLCRQVPGMGRTGRSAPVVARVQHHIWCYLLCHVRSSGICTYCTAMAPDHLRRSRSRRIFGFIAALRRRIWMTYSLRWRTLS